MTTNSPDTSTPGAALSPAQLEIQRLRSYVSSQIIGQDLLVERMIIALLADGHLLVEGAPGLAKTRAINTLARAIEGDFHRVQFTPDLLPADLTGTEIYRPQDATFHFQQGPLFHNLVLADEINRSPAKVQSALLEAMAERQITVGNGHPPERPDQHRLTPPVPRIGQGNADVLLITGDIAESNSLGETARRWLRFPNHAGWST